MTEMFFDKQWIRLPAARLRGLSRASDVFTFSSNPALVMMTPKYGANDTASRRNILRLQVKRPKDRGGDDWTAVKRGTASSEAPWASLGLWEYYSLIMKSTTVVLTFVLYNVVARAAMRTNDFYSNTSSGSESGDAVVYLKADWSITLDDPAAITLRLAGLLWILWFVIGLPLCIYLYMFRYRKRLVSVKMWAVVSALRFVLYADP